MCKALDYGNRSCLGLKSVSRREYLIFLVNEDHAYLFQLKIILWLWIWKVGWNNGSWKERCNKWVKILKPFGRWQGTLNYHLLSSFHEVLQTQQNEILEWKSILYPNARLLSVISLIFLISREALAQRRGIHRSGNPASHPHLNDPCCLNCFLFLLPWITSWVSWRSKFSLLWERNKQRGVSTCSH